MVTGKQCHPTPWETAAPGIMRMMTEVTALLLVVDKENRGKITGKQCHPTPWETTAPGIMRIMTAVTALLLRWTRKQDNGHRQTVPPHPLGNNYCTRNHGMMTAVSALLLEMDKEAGERSQANSAIPPLRKQLLHQVAQEW